MRKRGVILGTTVILLLFSSWLLVAEDINIQVRFFEGTWTGDQLGLNQVEILSTASHPEIESLKRMAGGPKSALKTAIIDALFDIMDLRTVDDIFSFVKTSLIISHRPIEPLKIDRLLWIENGRFQEMPLAEKAKDFCSVMQAVPPLGRWP